MKHNFLCFLIRGSRPAKFCSKGTCNQWQIQVQLSAYSCEGHVLLMLKPWSSLQILVPLSRSLEGSFYLSKGDGHWRHFL